MTMIRTRWAALGAAVAVTAGAGTIGLVQAESESSGSSFVSVVPCRMLDTRSDASIGSIGTEGTITLDGRGAVGDCELPEDATGLSVNIAAIRPTDDTYLTAYPAGDELPTSSHLNAAAGSVTSNGVDVSLSKDGQLDIYNANGDVDVIVDVLGAFVPAAGGGEAGPKGETGPQGEAGPQGEPGEPGAPGAGGLTIVPADIELVPLFFGEPFLSEGAQAIEPLFGEYVYSGPIDACGEGLLLDAAFAPGAVDGLDSMLSIGMTDFDEFYRFGPGPDTAGAMLQAPYLNVYVDYSDMYLTGPDFAPGEAIEIPSVTVEVNLLCSNVSVDGDFDGEPDNDIEDHDEEYFFYLFDFGA